MKKTYYSIYDNLGEKFKVPVLFDNENVAKRWFSDVVNSKENDVIFNNPMDFELHRLGTYDDETGELKADHSKIVNGRALKKGE